MTVLRTCEHRPNLVRILLERIGRVYVNRSLMLRVLHAAVAIGLPADAWDVSAVCLAESNGGTSGDGLASATVGKSSPESIVDKGQAHSLGL